MAYSINKTLYVGIGGTGAKTLVKIKRHFIDAYGEIPNPMIGFLVIDTQDGIINSTVAKSGSDVSNTLLYTVDKLNNRVTDVKEIGAKDVRLAPKEVKCVTVTNALSIYQSQPNEFTWMPQPPRCNISTLSTIKATGAGQVRSNGCFIARYNEKDITEHIKQAIRAVSDPDPDVDSKFQLGKGKTPDVDSRTTINVICSISGGTGSGMLIDILEQIQSASTGIQCDVVPWIVMPDIYKQVTPTGSFNVYYNTYGTLRDLDFIFEKATDRAIPFGNRSINHRLFDFAYLINNISRSGNSFNSLDDLLDDVAKCAFLPSGDMGTQADEMKDNIINNQRDYDFGSKRAWASSVSSAEMIYDSATVGIATSYSVANKLTAKLLNTTQTTGSELCDNFVDRQDVKIRETGGDLHNDVIDAICNLNAIQPFEVEKGTEAADIVNRLNILSEDPTSSVNCESKLGKTTSLLCEEICKILCSKDGGGLGNSVAFLAAMEGFIDSCLTEMNNESKDLEQRLLQTPDWATELRECRNFLGMFSQDRASDLSDTINSLMRDKQDLKRHQLAILFYSRLKETCSTYKSLLSAKADTVRKAGQVFDAEVSKLRNTCMPKSKFQIYLHRDAMKNVNPIVSQQMWNDFCKSDSLPSNGNLSDWLSLSSDSLNHRIMLFAGKTSPVSDELKKTIEDVLRDMGPERLIKNTKYVLDLATPMWTLDYHGKATKKVSIGRQVLVGVPDQGYTIMKSASVVDALTYGTTEPKFASTYQTDRIYIMMGEYSAPIFAVNNFKAYEDDYNEKEQNKNGLSCSIDIKMDAQRVASGHSMWPEEKPAVSLDLWTQGFCFNASDGQPIIRFDNEKRQYWIRSRQFGDQIHNYRYDLGETRTDAYNQFQILGLFNEVQEAIDKIIRESGSKFVSDKLESLRGTGNDTYFSDCVVPNMNPTEYDGIQNNRPVYSEVANLIKLEIDLRTK